MKFKAHFTRFFSQFASAPIQGWGALWRARAMIRGTTLAAVVQSLEKLGDNCLIRLSREEIIVKVGSDTLAHASFKTVRVVHWRALR